MAGYLEDYAPIVKKAKAKKKAKAFLSKKKAVPPAFPPKPY
jgi:hypothetical protein